MNILSAIFKGQTGFLKATESMAARASRIAHSSADGYADEKLIEDLVGMQVDKTFAKANTRTIKVADSLLTEFIRESMKK